MARCDHCHGKGTLLRKTDCTDCNKTGRTICDGGCGGTGNVPQAPGDTGLPFKCLKCGGLGRIDHAKCNGQGFYPKEETCPDCTGSGQKPQKRCPKCSGTGSVSEVASQSCYSCGGSGTIASGETSTTCSACGGSGSTSSMTTVTCTTCNGLCWVDADIA